MASARLNDKVVYQAYGSPNGEHKPLPRAAVVTQVNDDGTVGLCIFNPTGLFFLSRAEFGNESGKWRWEE